MLTITMLILWMCKLWFGSSTLLAKVTCYYYGAEVRFISKSVFITFKKVSKLMSLPPFHIVFESNIY